ncbi:SAM dependent carboxyl methyltransferase [Trema orientale]|uniref:SAM dependent carboxyl methyltransferase n=1 Tax=Trema orientale TaxID=63057 RepID=A0A2P5E9Z0_TREOI|nr:SAM dependent carboxyl methyltransferase [Trema orientale]
MATEETNQCREKYPMKGGDGSYSYAKNSTYQKGVSDAAKGLVTKAIEDKLDIEILLSPKTFCIVDMGCSVGPNTFSVVKNILEAVESRYRTHQIPEFQVFFNDHTSNDFNHLFKSLPLDRKYYALGAPGSFYGRVFPNNSIHFVHSSYAVQWLSSVPKEILNKNSSAWNKGRIHYSNSAEEVVRAYEAQFAEDIQWFLHCRAQEIVCGGLMVLIIPGRPNETPHSQTLPSLIFELLGTCLMDMANKGIVSGEKVDCFNIPIYYMSPQELEIAVERNGCFSIERVEIIPQEQSHANLPEKARQLASHMRAATEGLIKEQFGEEILDELFDSYTQKIQEKFPTFQSGKGINFFVLLQRKATK